MIARRTVLIGTLAIAASGTALFSVFSTRRVFERVLAKAFAPQIVAHPETSAFLDSYVERWRARQPTERTLSERLKWARHWVGLDDVERMSTEAQLLRAFVRETTVVRAEEVGEDLVFLGPSDPLGNPCANPLSSLWL